MLRLLCLANVRAVSFMFGSTVSVLVCDRFEHWGNSQDPVLQMLIPALKKNSERVRFKWMDGEAESELR